MRNCEEGKFYTSFDCDHSVDVAFCIVENKEGAEEAPRFSLVVVAAFDSRAILSFPFPDSSACSVLA